MKLNVFNYLTLLQPKIKLAELNCIIPVISVDFNSKWENTRTQTFPHSQSIERILMKKEDDCHDMVSRRIAMLRYGVKNTHTQNPCITNITRHSSPEVCYSIRWPNF